MTIMHKIKEVMNFKEDDYEIWLYFNFYILLVYFIVIRETLLDL